MALKVMLKNVSTGEFSALLLTEADLFTISPLDAARDPFAPLPLMEQLAARGFVPVRAGTAVVAPTPVRRFGRDGFRTSAPFLRF